MCPPYCQTLCKDFWPLTFYILLTCIVISQMYFTCNGYMYIILIYISIYMIYNRYIIQMYLYIYIYRYIRTYTYIASRAYITKYIYIYIYTDDVSPYTCITHGRTHSLFIISSCHRSLSSKSHHPVLLARTTCRVAASFWSIIPSFIILCSFSSARLNGVLQSTHTGIQSDGEAPHFIRCCLVWYCRRQCLKCDIPCFSQETADPGLWLWHRSIRRSLITAVPLISQKPRVDALFPGALVWKKAPC